MRRADATCWPWTNLPQKRKLETTRRVIYKRTVWRDCKKKETTLNYIYVTKANLRQEMIQTALQSHVQTSHMARTFFFLPLEIPSSLAYLFCLTYSILCMVA